MRCFQRVARSAALFRDRPAGAMRSALPDAVPTHLQHAYPRPQVPEPFDEAVTCGSVPRVVAGGRASAFATFDRSILRRPVGTSGGEPFNGRVK